MIRVLTGLSPMYYALAYLVLIPLYAIIYISQPHSFYHSTSKYEPELFNQKDTIIKRLESDFRMYYGDYFNKRDTIISGNSTLLISQSEVGDFWIENDYAYAVFNFFTANGKDTTNDYIIMKYSLFESVSTIHPEDTLNPWLLKRVLFKDFNNKHVMKVNDFDLGVFGKKGYDTLLYAIKKYEKHIDVNMIGHIKEYDLVNGIDSLRDQKLGYNFFFISDYVDNLIYSYYYAINGFPNYSNSETFFSMLYLSSITITTVGYGDILPITDTARILVASEAVLGIVIIGLFLNSLAARIRR